MLAPVLLLCGAAFALDDDTERHNGCYPYEDAMQIGRERGYADGFRHGGYDYSRRVGYDYRSEDYDHADRGYRYSFGSLRQYRHGYRQGYREGYDHGYGSRTRGRDVLDVILGGDPCRYDSRDCDDYRYSHDYHRRHGEHKDDDDDDE